MRQRQCSCAVSGFGAQHAWALILVRSQSDDLYARTRVMRYAMPRSANGNRVDSDASYLENVEVSLICSGQFPLELGRD